uniref:Peptidase S1 domain-containing protein n=1 Tax=Vitrella brassicaformis TaxID=1169539 RepID=A0A7S1P5Q8_9ALVE
MGRLSPCLALVLLASSALLPEASAATSAAAAGTGKGQPPPSESKQPDVSSLCDCSTFTSRHLHDTSAPKRSPKWFVASESPVCATSHMDEVIDGITFASPCLALCQQQHIRHRGSCEDIDNGAFKLSEDFSFASLADIRKSKAKDRQLTPAVVHRFRSDGYVFVGRITGGTEPQDLADEGDDEKNEEPEPRKYRSVRIVPGGDTYARLLASTDEEVRQRLMDKGLHDEDQGIREGNASLPTDWTMRPRPARDSDFSRGAINMTTDAPEEKCVVGGESRTIGSKQTDYPWRTSGFLSISTSDGDFRCSGIVAGSPITGMTAAHCFTNRKPGGGNVFVENFRARFCPGQSGSERPFGCVSVRRITVPGEWLSRRNRPREYDWGVMLFAVPIGAQTGYVPIGSACKRRLFTPKITVWMLSYPGFDDRSDRRRVFFEKRDDFNFRCRQKVNHKFDTNGGASGAGMTEFRNGYWWLRAVHNKEVVRRGRCRFNEAAKMTGRNSNQAREIIAEQSS